MVNMKMETLGRALGKRRARAIVRGMDGRLSKLEYIFLNITIVIYK